MSVSNQTTPAAAIPQAPALPENNKVGIRFNESVSGALYEKAMGYLTVGQNDSQVMRVAKFTAKEVASIGSFAFGSIEAVIRNVILVAAKTLQFFIPKNYSTTFDNKVLTPLRQHAYVSTVNALDAGSKFVTNAMSEDKQSQVNTKIKAAVDAVYFSNFSTAVANLHIDGFSAKSNPFADAIKNEIAGRDSKVAANQLGALEIKLQKQQAKNERNAMITDLDVKLAPVFAKKLEQAKAEAAAEAKAEAAAKAAAEAAKAAPKENKGLFGLNLGIGWFKI